VALACAILVGPLVRTALRVVPGACYAGLVILAESWINASTTRRHRGRVFALYNVVLSAGWIVSQPLLTVADPAGFVLFCIVSICRSLALVPITLTRAGVPGFVQASRAGLGRLYRLSPMGLAGVLASGLVTGAI